MNAQRITTEANRLLPLARTVLDRYPFRVERLDHLTTHSNVMYQVVTADGHQRVLRMGSPHGNTRTNIEYEVAWLVALNRETTLDLVRPIATRNGEYIVDVADPDSDLQRSCVLFSWVPGAPLGSGAGTFGYRLLGKMSASLHIHGARWRPASPGGMRLWDRTFYYDRELDPVIVDDGRYDHLFDVTRRAKVHQATAIGNRVIHDAWRSETPQVVHGDLHEWNAHLVRSRLYAFDFEDVMVATRSQDVAISLYSSRQQPRAPEIRAAFRRGYEEIAPWPIVDDAQLDGFHAARQAMLMNYAVRTLPGREAADYLDQVFPWMDAYVRKYG